MEKNKQKERDEFQNLPEPAVASIDIFAQRGLSRQKKMCLFKLIFHSFIHVCLFIVDYSCFIFHLFIHVCFIHVCFIHVCFHSFMFVSFIHVCLFFYLCKHHHTSSNNPNKKQNHRQVNRNHFLVALCQ